jgi:hypothetical protein
LGDLVLFKKQLISNSYERVRLEKGDQNEKYSKHEWRAISFEKNAFWYSNLNNHVNYTILVPQHFPNSILVQNFIFIFIFWSLVEQGERERSPNSNGGERNMSLTPI